MIDTRIVYGFKGAGKTSYILDCIINDFFYKDASTLILCFEKGKQEYDEQALSERNARVIYYDGQKDIGEFCLDPIRKYDPDRIYVEMNAQILMLREKFPDAMNVTYAVTLVDFSTLDQHLAKNIQALGRMVSGSQQIIFLHCGSKDLLAPYSQEFRLLNPEASYLRRDPMGYHEKAFELFVPYSLEPDEITIGTDEYLAFWLDAADHPEHYEGKLLRFKDALELKHFKGPDVWSAGRLVMTCCMSDLQFMSLELTGDLALSLHGGWITLEAAGWTGKDEYGRKVLKLELKQFGNSAPPGSVILKPQGFSQRADAVYAPAVELDMSAGIFRKTQ